MSRYSIIVSHSLAADNSKPTVLGWKPLRFYFTSVKYNTSASLAQATSKPECAAIGIVIRSIVSINDTRRKPRYAISGNECRFTIGRWILTRYGATIRRHRIISIRRIGSRAMNSGQRKNSGFGSKWSAPGKSRFTSDIGRRPVSSAAISVDWMT
jgi:hypothetical protein